MKILKLTKYIFNKNICFTFVTNKNKSKNTISKELINTDNESSNIL